MTGFEIKQSYHLSLNREARERMREIQDHLEENYDGIAHFVRQKLHEEQALSIEERMNRKRQELNEVQQDLEKLQRIHREREEQDKLRDKKELLKEKQKKLREVQKKGLLSEEEIREEEIEKRSKYNPRENPEVMEVVDRQVEKRLKNRPDVDELVEDVERLQRQVAELNGGRESWFMSLDREAEEVEA